MEGSERRVAVVGDGDRATGLRETVRRTDGRLVEPTRTSDGDDAEEGADAVIAVGDDAIRESLVDAAKAPVIPVGRRRLAFDPDDAARRVRQLLDASVTRVGGDSSTLLDGDGSIRRVTHPVLAADTGTGPVRRAAFDVALVTEEPARISEFAIGFPDESGESFRADGIVVATPFGSDGYANAVGGPLVEPGGGLSVVPIATFSTHTDSWIATNRATVSIEREAEPVALVIDGTKTGIVDPHHPIEIEVVDRIDLLVPASTAASRARRSETL